MYSCIMKATKPHAISDDALLARLEELAGRTLDPNAGIFGPASMTWHLGRHTSLFWGSWRAVLLQLAHPWVANAVCQHSHFMEDPLGRFHRTFSTMFKMTFGDLDTALTTARGLHAMHTRIKGRIACPAGRFKTGTHYQANEAHALFWVQATLIDTTVRVFEQTVRPLKAEEKARYYEESKRMLCLFGIPEDLVPPDWYQFQAYNRDMWASDTLSVCDSARTSADYLFRIRQMPATWVMSAPAKLATSVMLPPRFRMAYGLPDPTPHQRRRYARTMRWTRRSFTRLPTHLRYATPYLEALQRLEGRDRARPVTRLMNRVGIGKPELVMASPGSRT
jgi:uncharacterized protein (DUF2236 family)